MTYWMTDLLNSQPIGLFFIKIKRFHQFLLEHKLSNQF